MNAGRQHPLWNRLQPLFDALLFETTLAGGGSARIEHLTLALFADASVLVRLSSVELPPINELRSVLAGSVTPEGLEGLVLAKGPIRVEVDHELLAFVETAIAQSVNVEDAKSAVLRRCLEDDLVSAPLRAIGVDPASLIQIL